MFRGTTPTITMNITTTLDLNQIDDLSIVIENRQRTRSKIYEKDDVVIKEEEKQLILGLSQEDTLYFSVGKIRLQLKIKMKDGKVYASKIQETTMDEILDERVM